jgi:hypothetical protein
VSALQAEIKEAVAATLAEVLPAIVEEAVRRAVAELRIGDAGDELLDTGPAAKLLGTTAGALRRSAERGRAPVEPVRLGRRLKWRRADLLSVAARPAA